MYHICRLPPRANLLLAVTSRNIKETTSLGSNYRSFGSNPQVLGPVGLCWPLKVEDEHRPCRIGSRLHCNAMGHMCAPNPDRSKKLRLSK
jgi:hypothetical protein